MTISVTKIPQKKSLVAMQLTSLTSVRVLRCKVSERPIICGSANVVTGGILTVADDLLKNDGKKFIEMMEQLAERRMAREEDAREAYSNPNYGHPSNGSMHPHSHAHNHPPPPEDEEYDDEDEEEDEYDSQDEDY